MSKIPPPGQHEELAEFASQALFAITQEDPIISDRFEAWFDENYREKADDEVKAQLWARVALLYVYLEAKMLMCSRPDLVRSFVGASREVCLEIGDAGWVALSPNIPDVTEEN